MRSRGGACASHNMHVLSSSAQTTYGASDPAGECMHSCEVVAVPPPSHVSPCADNRDHRSGRPYIASAPRASRLGGSVRPRIELLSTAPRLVAPNHVRVRIALSPGPCFTHLAKIGASGSCQFLLCEDRREPKPTPRSRRLPPLPCPRLAGELSEQPVRHRIRV